MLMCISIFSVYSVIAVALERYTTVVGLSNKVALTVFTSIVFIIMFMPRSDNRQSCSLKKSALRRVPTFTSQTILPSFICYFLVVSQLVRLTQPSTVCKSWIFILAILIFAVSYNFVRFFELVVQVLTYTPLQSHVVKCKSWKTDNLNSFLKPC